MTPTTDPRPSNGDEALRRALQALPPDPQLADPAAEAALQRRVLARWAAAQATAAAPAPAAALAAGGPDVAGGGWRTGGPSSQARRLVLAGLVALAAVAAWMGLQRPDPTVDELMRLDVLSQIAAGEL